MPYIHWVLSVGLCITTSQVAFEFLWSCGFYASPLYFPTWYEAMAHNFSRQRLPWAQAWYPPSTGKRQQARSIFLDPYNLPVYFREAFGQSLVFNSSSGEERQSCGCLERRGGQIDWPVDSGMVATCCRGGVGTAWPSKPRLLWWRLLAYCALCTVPNICLHQCQVNPILWKDDRLQLALTVDQSLSMDSPQPWQWQPHEGGGICYDVSFSWGRNRSCAESEPDLCLDIRSRKVHCTRYPVRLTRGWCGSSWLMGPTL